MILYFIKIAFYGKRVRSAFDSECTQKSAQPPERSANGTPKIDQPDSSEVEAAAQRRCGLSTHPEFNQVSRQSSSQNQVPEHAGPFNCAVTAIIFNAISETLHECCGRAHYLPVVRGKCFTHRLSLLMDFVDKSVSGDQNSL